MGMLFSLIENKSPVMDVCLPYVRGIAEPLTRLAYITNALVFHASYFGRAHTSLCFFFLFGTKWREDREDMCSSCFESTKCTYLKCINDFCQPYFMENDESCAVAYCESCFFFSERK